MPVSEIVLKKVGRELREWIYLGIRAGMYQAAIDYNRMKLSQTSQAILLLKRGVDLPRRARYRIDYAISRYGLPALQQAIALEGTCTISELNTELTILQNYAQGLHDHVINDGWTWDQVASDILSKVNNEVEQWIFVIPPGYVDIWGE